MNKNINKSIRTGVLVFAGLLVSYACSDTWDEHYDANLANGNVVDATIYQQLKTEGLTDFVEILDATGYNALLDESQLVTVFAPMPDISLPAPLPSCTKPFSRALNT